MALTGPANEVRFNESVHATSFGNHLTTREKANPAWRVNVVMKPTSTKLKPPQNANAQMPAVIATAGAFTNDAKRRELETLTQKLQLATVEKKGS